MSDIVDGRSFPKMRDIPLVPFYKSVPGYKEVLPTESDIAWLQHLAGIHHVPNVRGLSGRLAFPDERPMRTIAGHIAHERAGGSV